MKEQVTIPGIEQKINEYVARIQAGENKEMVLQGLPASWVSAVEKKLAIKPETSTEEKPENILLSNSSDSLLEEKSLTHHQNEKVLKEKDQIEQLRGLLGAKKNEYKKLSGWAASYELAKIAKLQNLDLASLSREEYVEYAVKNGLAIDDAQLRAHPSQRNGTSVEEVIQMMKQEKSRISTESEKNFARFSHDMMLLAEKPQQERFLFDNVRVLSGTKDSNSWLFFSINNGTNPQESDTYKSYFAMKDLNNLTPDRFKNFMKFLQENGYNGGVKIFQDMTEQGTKLNDQVVMHGYSDADAKLAIQLAEQYFKNELESKSFGKDEIVEGKSKSYSQLLAEQIRNRVQGNNS